jgi:hypothetical protein
MPAGLTESLTRAELVDLVRFLSELGKVGPFSVGRSAVVRRWQTMSATPEAQKRLNRTSFDLAATGDKALLWQPAYSNVSGSLPIGELPAMRVHANLPRTAFVRFAVNVSSPGKIELAFDDVTGLKLWLDGAPMKVSKQLPLDLPTGDWPSMSRHAAPICAVNL